MPNTKRTCYGCKALEFNGLGAECLLGYPLRMKDKTPLRPEPVPIDNKCPKPRTYEALFELLNN